MKRIKYLRIYLPKETKDLYIENYKTLVKDIKEDTNRWRNIPCLWIGRINIVKMSIQPKAIYRFNSIPLGRPSAPAPSIQYSALNLTWQLISYMIFYMFQCHSPKSSHPLPLPQSP